MTFQEIRIYHLSEIDLRVSVEYSSCCIKGIHLNLQQQNSMKNEKNLGKNDPKTERILEELIRLKTQMWEFLEHYFSGAPIKHLSFFETINKYSNVFGHFSRFSQKIYRELCKTDIGDITTYKELALSINSRAFQAVGTAMRRNKFPILIPCHRVVSTNGIGGFMGKKSKLKDVYKIINNNSKLHDFDQKLSEPIKIKILLLKYEKNMKGE
ncbi:MAG: methylated-DNA--[protein]-cysteine S-methyltransferase [Promethearchaeota archaeon]